MLGLRLSLPELALGRITPLLALVPPAALGWTPAFTIFRRGAVYSTDFDVAALKPAVTKTYNVDPVSGNDGGTGQGWGTSALKSLSVALAKSDVDRIVLEDFGVDGTIYLSTRGWNAVSPTRSIVVTTRAGRRVSLVKAASATPATWTLVSGNVYATAVTAGNTGAPMDLSARDAQGLFTRLVQASGATTAPPAGQYWHDTAGALGTAGLMYVQAPDSRNLVGSATMIPPCAGNNVSCNITTDIAPTLWLENLDCVGGTPLNAQVLTTLTGRPRVVTRNCTFQGGVAAANGTNILGPWDVYHQDCVSGGNLKDGFNRHANSFGAARAFLHRCRTGRNGYDTQANNNADTQHESCVSIALGCTFTVSQNRCVDHIDQSVGWLLDSDLGPSLASDATGISVHTGGTAKIYLDGCRIAHSASLDMAADSGSFIYASRMSMAGLTTSGSVVLL